MRRVRVVLLGWMMVTGLLPAVRAGAEILDIKADLTSSVREFDSGVPRQSDIAMVSFPATSTALPLSAISQLTGTDDSGNIVAAGRGVTVFNDPRTSGVVAPDDFGMDLSAFSTSPTRSWLIEGSAVERRTINFTPLDAFTVAGRQVRIQSSFFISGVLILSATNANRDLTGTTAAVEFSIRREGGGGSSEVVLSGAAALEGGPAGDVSASTSGVVDAGLHPMTSLDGIVPELPLLRIVSFNALLPVDQYRFEYDAIVDQPFDLVLEFKGRLATLPDGVGGAVVFGLPQVGFGEVVQQIGGSLAGVQAQDSIATLVDTTARPPGGGTIITPLAQFPALPDLCGALGGGSPGLLAAAAIGMTLATVRRRRRRVRHV